MRETLKIEINREIIDREDSELRSVHIKICGVKLLSVVAALVSDRSEDYESSRCDNHKYVHPPKNRRLKKNNVNTPRKKLISIRLPRS